MRTFPVDTETGAVTFASLTIVLPSLNVEISAIRAPGAMPVPVTNWPTASLDTWGKPTGSWSWLVPVRSTSVVGLETYVS